MDRLPQDPNRSDPTLNFNSPESMLDAATGSDQTSLLDNALRTCDLHSSSTYSLESTSKASSPPTKVVHHPMTRASHGIFWLNPRYRLAVKASSIVVPKSIKSALQSLDWKVAMSLEYNALAHKERNMEVD